MSEVYELVKDASVLLDVRPFAVAGQGGYRSPYCFVKGVFREGEAPVKKVKFVKASYAFVEACVERSQKRAAEEVAVFEEEEEEDFSVEEESEEPDYGAVSEEFVPSEEEPSWKEKPESEKKPEEKEEEASLSKYSRRLAAASVRLKEAGLLSEDWGYRSSSVEGRKADFSSPEEPFKPSFKLGMVGKEEKPFRVFGSDGFSWVLTGLSLKRACEELVVKTGVSEERGSREEAELVMEPLVKYRSVHWMGDLLGVTAGVRCRFSPVFLKDCVVSRFPRFREVGAALFGLLSPESLYRQRLENRKKSPEFYSWFLSFSEEGVLSVRKPSELFKLVAGSARRKARSLKACQKEEEEIRRIVSVLSHEPAFVGEIAEKVGLSKQKAGHLLKKVAGQCFDGLRVESVSLRTAQRKQGLAYFV